MINFLWDNKEWFFSGLGILILVVLFKAFRAFWNKKKTVPSSGPEHVNEETTVTTSENNGDVDSEGRVLSEPIMPHQIKKAIENFPLLQRTEAAKHYIDMHVVWRLPLADISKKRNDPNTVTLHLTDQTDFMNFASVFFDVSSDKYPGLGLLKEKDIVEVDGRIKKIDFNIIKLYDAKIRYWLALACYSTSILPHTPSLRMKACDILRAI